MSQVILHHYPLSPYSEKIRLAMGLKGVKLEFSRNSTVDSTSSAHPDDGRLSADTHSPGGR